MTDEPYQAPSTGNDPSDGGAETNDDSNSPRSVLRAAAIVPVALLAGYLGWNLGGMFGLLRGTGSPESLLQFLSHVPSGMALVWGGAAVAPRRHVIVASVLACCGALLSLQTHIFGQSSPGLNNVLHVSGECTGLLLGIWLTAKWQRGRSAGRDTGSDASNPPPH